MCNKVSTKNHACRGRGRASTLRSEVKVGVDAIYSLTLINLSHILCSSYFLQVNKISKHVYQIYWASI